MSARALNALQVAALLVSASYGIGFLFGSGELAIDHGMAGSVYGLATGTGMLMLALLAPRLWRLRESIWELFGRRFGESLEAAVASMSTIWMAGVLAAQLLGGVAVLTMLGLAPTWAWIILLGSCLTVSRLRLEVVSTVFTVLLLCSGTVLVHALWAHQGVEIYLDAPAQFVAATATFEPGAILAISVAVVALVCSGSDSHQYVQAARSPVAAAWGCALAGVVLLFLSFLPPAVVVSMRSAGALASIAAPSQVIPFAVSQSAENLFPGLDHLSLIALSTAALGSAAAILRTMARALARATTWLAGAPPSVLDLVAIAMAGLMAATGQGIVDTMVSANVVYIASVGPVFVAILTGYSLSGTRATRSVAAGFATASTAQVLARVTELPWDPHLVSLAAGMASAALALAVRRRAPDTRAFDALAVRAINDGGVPPV